ncbi:MAG: aquaporin family protein [Tannerella sp.]|nr:aquaporin family protein [Tannerella sp.]
MFEVTSSQFLGEIFGSFTLIALGLGISMNLNLKRSYNEGNRAAISGPLSWGFAVAMAIVVAMPFNSGAHFNPAVTISFAAVGIFPWASVFPYMLAQAIGSFFGAIAVWVVYGSQFRATDDSKTLLGVFATNASVRNPFYNFANETLATFFLVFISLVMVTPKIELDGISGNIGLGANGALINGFLIFTLGMAFGGVTGWSMNPARDLMPRLVHQLLPIKGKGGSDWGYGVRNAAIAPVCGGILAASIYLLIKPYLI